MTVGDMLITLSTLDYSEEAIVGLLAAKAIRKGLNPEYGDRGKIYELVNATYPPHGYKQKRRKAVVEEVSRQVDLRSERAAARRGCPTKEALTVKERRSKLAMSILSAHADNNEIVHIGYTADIKRTVRGLIILCEINRRRYYVRERVIAIVTKDKIELHIVTWHARYTSFATFGIDIVPDEVLNDRLRKGEHLRIDVNELETQFVDKSGNVVAAYPWISDAKPIVLDRTTTSVFRRD